MYNKRFFAWTDTVTPEYRIAHYLFDYRVCVWQGLGQPGQRCGGTEKYFLQKLSDRFPTHVPPASDLFETVDEALKRAAVLKYPVEVVVAALWARYGVSVFVEPMDEGAFWRCHVGKFTQHAATRENAILRAIDLYLQHVELEECR